MSEVFSLIFSIFGFIITELKRIPVFSSSDGTFISIFDFSIALICMSIIISAFVSRVKTSGSPGASRRASRKSDDD